ncbi:hypothetical protein TPHA_0D02840 [Tetrapisispora phaffii CBS 4417]|uniref:Carbon catabolite-derepressing protein kinase n=1 Tax=Tetrapisispora phaffii (strain ATCC 24235 / CBS 4417 / NBRC 1672 / NRRL Y-8282 / UCD 70-5) TaxID=1071381 RepID=G8BSU9_TETPH|nr:hypothetical protein TPHA_0D02840 [Tetrapisispora phaffii CBS 4417]CCE62920.1 hypothetical protein TPHA_0D02840 [Tetrapisispora phaffii CBS 4417]
MHIVSPMNALHPKDNKSNGMHLHGSFNGYRQSHQQNDQQSPKGNGLNHVINPNMVFGTLSDGARIGNYQIIKTLGEGSFGKVKLAYHVTTNQKVALKIINKKVLAKSDMQGRVEREISFLRLLRHPHIIKLYDVIKSKDEIIMVIEYANNELFEYIVQRDKMTENEARKFFQQIISAVEYCHRHKIVHRDLKPENLLLDENLNVKIADFGLSNIMTDGNFLKTSCGSPNYAAPEVISGKLYAGPEVDVWSCGVILYVMLCRRLPFDDDSIPALFKNISNGIYTLPKFLSEGAANLIKKMLIVNPLNRISMTEIIHDEWFKVDFPEYLLESQANSTSEELMKKANKDNQIDDRLVDALSKIMGYDKNEIYNCLRTEIAEDSNSPNSSMVSEIKNAYTLLKENEQIMESHADNSNFDTILSQTLPSFQQRTLNKGNSTTPDEERTPMFLTQHMNEGNSGVAILPTSLPQLHRANMLSSGLLQNSNIHPLVSKKSKTKWHFGIRSRSYPLDVMGEIYIALKNLGAEWAKPSEEDLWTIRVRWKYSGSNQIANNEANNSQNQNNEKIPDLLKIVIQLFQIETNNYLVDFKFDGWEDSSGAPVTPSDITSDEISAFSAYPFLHLTTRLIMELAVNSQNV